MHTPDNYLHPEEWDPFYYCESEPEPPHCTLCGWKEGEDNTHPVYINALDAYVCDCISLEPPNESLSAFINDSIFTKHTHNPYTMPNKWLNLINELLNKGVLKLPPFNAQMAYKGEKGVNFNFPLLQKVLEAKEQLKNKL